MQSAVNYEISEPIARGAPEFCQLMMSDSSRLSILRCLSFSEESSKKERLSPFFTSQNTGAMGSLLRGSTNAQHLDCKTSIAGHLQLPLLMILEPFACRDSRKLDLVLQVSNEIQDLEC